MNLRFPIPSLSTQPPTHNPLHNLLSPQPSLPSHPHQLPLFNINPTILPPLLNIHEPDHNTSTTTQRKQEGETQPVIIRFIDDSLDDVRADNWTGPIRDPEETEEHAFVAWWRYFWHHGLSVCVVGCLEEAEEDVVDPEVVGAVVAYFSGPEA